MGKRLVVQSNGAIEWLEVPERNPGPGEARITPLFGVEKHGTMAAFVKGYGNERGRWDSEHRMHRSEGTLWPYPVPLGNMQFGKTEAGERVAWWGAFESDPVISDSSLIRMGEIGWRDAAMQDPGEFALGALRDANARIGDRIAVFGLGAIGLAAVQLAVASGASQVFAIDPIASRRAVAEKYGATAVDPEGIDVGLVLREATSMTGVDVVIDYSGAWRALQSGLRGVAYGGTIAYGAFPAPFPAGLDLGGEAHMNRGKIVFTRSCSEPNPDFPRWDETRVKKTVWSLIERGLLRGESIVDEPVPFDDLDRVYPEIAKHPETHLKLATVYPTSPRS
ncbi:MAG: zinc-binding alcohol dehydrogenase [Fimbriimonas sp.]|nr:zinc-binding alcohol dehydrogenase [Fimbriimonas sp.]